MTNISDLPQHLQQRLRAELKPGESITWAGQPNPNRFMKSRFPFWFIFIPWIPFSLFWIARAFNFQMPNFDSGWSLFPIYELLFLLFGLAGLHSSLWLRRKARSTIYAVTNHCVISIEGAKSITVKSYMASDLVDIERTEHPDGRGDLVLQSERYRDSDGELQTRDHGFFAIDNVRRVESIIENLVRMNHS